MRARGQRSPVRRAAWRGLAISVLAVLTVVSTVAFVPAWRDTALDRMLLWSGEIGAPTDPGSVALCAATQHGLRSWVARRCVVPRGRVIAGTITSATLHGAHRPYYVYLPPGYSLSLFRQVHYPTVYLLHGAPGTARDWYLGGHINTVADYLISSCRMRPMILVLPDGNGGVTRDSQYINRWDGTENDEIYLVHDVVTFVDQHFRTIRDPRFRALLGLSEGGYGAVNLTVRHPDVFTVAVGISGYFQADPHQAMVWATNPFGHNPTVLRANSPILRVATLPVAVRRHLHFLIYDGADDTDYAHYARAFTHQLAHLDIAYTWNQRRDPALVWRYHNWIYWRTSAQDALVRLSRLFMSERRGAGTT